MLLTLPFPSLEAAESPDSARDARYGGELRIGDSNPPTIINPLLVTSGISVSISNLIFNRLIRSDFNGQLGPDLAERWEVSEDGLSYTFYLRQNLRFHDGVSLTSADVAFTFDLIRNPALKSPYFSSMQRVERIETPDAYTFRIVLSKPYAPFIHDLNREILPKHIFEGENFRSNPANERPVGTGPFRFQERTPDGHIILEANPDYFEGRPYLDRVVFKAYRDKSEVWSAFMRGEIDLVRFISRENYEWTRQDPTFATYAVPMNNYYVLSYNLNDPVFSDREVRRGLSRAIDRKSLINEMEEGYGDESRGPFESSSWAIDTSIEPIDYDPETALEIFRKAGWEMNGDQLEKDGKPFTFSILVNSADDKLPKMAMRIRQQLQELGIRAEIEPYANDLQVMEHMQETVDKRSRAYLTMLPGGGPDPNVTATLWLSTDIRRGKILGFSRISPDVDALVLQAQITPDKNTRAEIYRRINRILYEEQPGCFLYFPYIFHAISKNVQGVDRYFESSYMPDDAIRKFFLKNDKSAKGGEN